MFSDAPALMSTRTDGRWPWYAAWCKAVSPPLCTQGKAQDGCDTKGAEQLTLQLTAGTVQYPRARGPEGTFL